MSLDFDHQLHMNSSTVTIPDIPGILTTTQNQLPNFYQFDNYLLINNYTL